MKASVIHHSSRLPFETVYRQLLENIAKEGLLLLHVIDTQSIVKNHNIHICPLKQLLCFKPKFIERILSEDPLAINDIPLKIVLYTLENGDTSISYQNPKSHLKDYALSESLLLELETILQRLIQI